MKRLKVLIILLCGLVSLTSCQKDTAISGVSLNKTTLSMTVWDTDYLSATVQPSDANQKVVWTSSNSYVATVEDGVVTAWNPGTTTITVTTESGTDNFLMHLNKKTATCVVTVKQRKSF